MTPKKNPYTLKGFMSILQGNTSKQEQSKKEEKKNKLEKDKKVIISSKI